MKGYMAIGLAVCGNICNHIASTVPYQKLINSSNFMNDLDELNHALVAKLQQFGEEARINGNLFYDHALKDFHLQPLTDKGLEVKRRRLYKAARRSNSMLEIGVNGGHSALLALSSNEKLHLTGIDICRQLVNTWCRVDVYVPKAFGWLASRFKDRVTLIEGHSLVESARYATNPFSRKIDLLHLDGAKDNYYKEFLLLRPRLSSDCLVILDDSNMPVVNDIVCKLISDGLLYEHPDFPEMKESNVYRNSILCASKL